MCCVDRQAAVTPPPLSPASSPIPTTSETPLASPRWRPRAGGPARQAAKVSSQDQDRPKRSSSVRRPAEPPLLCQRSETGRGLGPRSEYTCKRDGSSGREAASALPRCLRHPKTRPVQSASGTRRPVPPAHPRAAPHATRRHPAQPSSPPPAADRRKAANRPSSNRKQGVSPGLTLRRIGASDARRAKAKRISERARAWMARSERPEGQLRAHPERPYRRTCPQPLTTYL